jgi:hypothetical protein
MRSDSFRASPKTRRCIQFRGYGPGNLQDFTIFNDAWVLTGGFGSLRDWFSYVRKSGLSEGGRVRGLVDPDGVTIVERLFAFDQAARSYTYSILRASFPVFLGSIFRIPKGLSKNSMTLLKKRIHLRVFENSSSSV